MNIDEMRLGDIKRIAEMFGEKPSLDNGMIGKYVLVRCRDAGVHCGVLQSHSGRECVLTQARRLWYWRPANGQKFLSGVATNGLAPDSKVGVPVDRIHLTENCEIIEMSVEAERSVREIKADEK